MYKLAIFCTLCEDAKIDKEKVYKTIEKQTLGETNNINKSDKTNYFDLTINIKNMHEDKININKGVNLKIEIIETEDKINLNLTSIIKHSVKNLENKCLYIKNI